MTEGITIEISYDDLLINKMVENVPDFEYNIVLSKLIHIKEVNKYLFCKLIEPKDAVIEDKNSINIDYDLVKGDLKVRNRRPGDKMVPSGMKGSKKIKDIFIDLKVPTKERNSKLIIADNENILWLEGFRIHDRYKVSPKTKKILNISIGRQNE